MSKLSELDRIKGSKILAIITISQSQLECQDYDSLEFMQWPPCTVPGKEKRLAVLYQCPSGKIRLLKLSCSMDTALSQVGRFLGSTWEKSVFKVDRKEKSARSRGYPRKFEKTQQVFSYFKGPYGQGYYDVSLYSSIQRDEEGKLLICLQGEISLPADGSEKAIYTHMREARMALKNICHSWNASQEQMKESLQIWETDEEEKLKKGEKYISPAAEKSSPVKKERLKGWKTPASMVEAYFGKTYKELPEGYSELQKECYRRRLTKIFEAKAYDLMLNLMDETAEE